MPRLPLWSSQPFKAIFIVAFLAKAPAHLALVALLYAVPSLRPQPAWTWRRNFMARFQRMIFEFVANTRLQLALYEEPSTARERHVHIDPPSQNVFSGIATSNVAKPAPVDAVWLSGLPTDVNDVAAMKKQKIVLHLPGGAFIMAFGHKSLGPILETVMTKHFNATGVIWAQYRLSTGAPEKRFPASLQDALTFYAYVLSLGFDPQQIILSGDSAGGNVVLALLRHLEEQQGQENSLPLPGGVLSFSPWVHVTPHAAEDYDKNQHSQSDVLISSLLQWGAEAYRPEGQLSTEAESYVSPLHRPFKTSVPLFIQDGGLEGFHADIAEFAAEMVETNGDRVRFHSAPLAPHDLIYNYDRFMMEDDMRTALNLASDFFDSYK